MTFPALVSPPAPRSIVNVIVPSVSSVDVTSSTVMATSSSFVMVATPSSGPTVSAVVANVTALSAPPVMLDRRTVSVSSASFFVSAVGVIVIVVVVDELSPAIVPEPPTMAV